MKRSLFLLAVVAVMAAPAAARADVLTDIVDPYLRIQTALSNDAIETVKTDAAKIAAEAGRLGEPAKDLKASAGALASAASLADARSAFGRLSDALIRFSESTRTSLGPDMNVAFCSMDKSTWVQKGSAIMNPYAGKKMQNCGEIVKKVK